jgi:frataxin-like iron-binding protein CyaY
MRDNFVFIRNFKNININTLLDEAYNLDWNAILNMNDINHMVTFFNDNINYLLNRHAPLIKINTNTQKTGFSFSSNLQNLANLRDFHYREWKRKRDDTSREYYKIARNMFNSTYDRERRIYEEREFNHRLPPNILFKKLRNIGITKQNSNNTHKFSSEDLNNH